MQDTSQITNYDTILASDYTVETKVNIAGVDYGENVLVEVSTSLALFDNIPCVGCCPSGEINIRMLTPNAVIPRMAKIIPYIRLKTESAKQYVINGETLLTQHGSVSGQTATLVDNASVTGKTLVLTNTTTTITSGWLKKGEYYIDTREETRDNADVSVLTIHGYDAMLMTESVYPVDNATYPKPDTYVVNKIAETIGVQVDSRTTAIMNKSYSINLPSTYTMREVLGYIAGMYCGNFCISAEGKLRLVGLTDIGVETNYLVDNNSYAIVFGTGSNATHIIV